MSLISLDGDLYQSPCEKCKDRYCSSCLFTKYREDLDKEREKRASAEFRIENELEPRIKTEKRAYDTYVSTDRSAEWCDVFDCRVNELVNMFDEGFDFSAFDFNGEDITSKVAKLIYEYATKKS